MVNGCQTLPFSAADPECAPLRAQVLVAHRDDVKIESVSVSKNFAVVFERLKGLQVCRTSTDPALLLLYLRASVADLR